MFAPVYFPGRFFAPRYFPPSGLVVVIRVPDVREDMDVTLSVSELLEILRAQQMMASMSMSVAEAAAVCWSVSEILTIDRECTATLTWMTADGEIVSFTSTVAEVLNYLRPLPDDLSLLLRLQSADNAVESGIEDDLAVQPALTDDLER